ncbi:MAG: hypothetical protein Q8M92_00730, partial [Candidatus Subteraquimicrobiales bacterium]|nr:hypothetical protein [Candidatus Subteraquimicrobiales bacterium]
MKFHYGMKKNKFLRITLILLPIFAFSFFVFNTQAANPGTIDATYNTAKFLDTANGTVNFKCTTGCNISINNSAITGYAWGDIVGWINFNPSGNPGVQNNTSGVLSGHAWGQNAGWVNFAPTNGGVSINTTNGEFNGFAWSQNYGWLEFDCSAAGKTAGKCVK